MPINRRDYIIRLATTIGVPDFVSPFSAQDDKDAIDYASRVMCSVYGSSWVCSIEVWEADIAYLNNPQRHVATITVVAPSVAVRLGQTAG